MTVVKTEEQANNTNNNSLLKDFPFFYSTVYAKTQKAIEEFFQKKFLLRFMSLSVDENIFFYGDEYFVNKIPVNKDSGIVIRISSSLVSSLIDNALGVSETPFKLNNITDIEANLIKAFTAHIYKNIEGIINKTEVNKKIIKNSKEYSFTFFAKYNKEHVGKIIISVPEYMITNIKAANPPQRFSIADFKTTSVLTKISVGTTRLALNDIKALEDGDIIVLENSDINKMSIMSDIGECKFRINPNPSLIISVDNNGGNEMEEETSSKSQNMWDSILVDVIAEFDNVKLTLGELKQISEGLVIDVGSVYDNKIKLRVENQVVASGELVILNDRYGVRIDSVKKAKEETAKPEPAQKPAAQAAAPAAKTAQHPAKAAAPAAKSNKQQAVTPAAKPAPKGEDDENFDYSDFEIEDESI